MSHFCSRFEVGEIDGDLIHVDQADDGGVMPRSVVSFDAYSECPAGKGAGRKSIAISDRYDADHHVSGGGERTVVTNRLAILDGSNLAYLAFPSQNRFECVTQG